MTRQPLPSFTHDPDATHELARWFLMSVLRHLQDAQWQDPDASGLEREQQERLVQRFMAEAATRKSLLAVLRDERLRWRLLRFARSRNPARGIVSESTVAFSRAKQLLAEAGLLDTPGRSTAASAEQADSPASPLSVQEPLAADHHQASIVQRRAERRQFRLAKRTSDPPPKDAGHDDARLQMSDEEYAQLEQILSREPPRATPSSPGRHLNEERVSLLSGMLAGVLVFVLVWWFFL